MHDRARVAKAATAARKRQPAGSSEAGSTPSCQRASQAARKQRRAALPPQRASAGAAQYSPPFRRAPGLMSPLASASSIMLRPMRSCGRHGQAQLPWLGTCRAAHMRTTGTASPTRRPVAGWKRCSLAPASQHALPAAGPPAPELAAQARSSAQHEGPRHAGKGTQPRRRRTLTLLHGSQLSSLAATRATQPLVTALRNTMGVSPVEGKGPGVAMARWARAAGGCGMLRRPEHGDQLAVAAAGQAQAPCRRRGCKLSNGNSGVCVAWRLHRRSAGARGLRGEPRATRTDDLSDVVSNLLAALGHRLGVRCWRSRRLSSQRLQRRA